MAGAQEAQAEPYALSALRSSTSFVIIVTAFSGGLAACVAAELMTPNFSLAVNAVHFIFVAMAIMVAGILSSYLTQTDSTQVEVRSLTQAVRSLRRDPENLHRLPEYGKGPSLYLAAELNALIETFELRQAELKEDAAAARKMWDRSESASLAKSHFLANMSHELRTPLNAIIGYAMLLQEDSQDAGLTDAVSDLDRILRSARHLLNLINDILDLSKIEAGKDRVDYSLIDIRVLIEETMAVVGQQTIETANVTFDLDLPDQDIHMHADAVKLRQCLVNLLSNAFKFTDEGHVKLRVATEPSKSGNTVVFEVEDTGIGIDEEKTENLFDAFVQADVMTTKKYGGTGLGLAITQRLTGLMGGEISLKSEPGIGSVFTIKLPQEPATRSLQPVSVAAPMTLAANDGIDDERLALVIDDDVSNVDLLSRWLKKQGYSVAAAYDGEAGLEVAREYEPELILLDIHMPRANGWEVLSELRADERLSKIPVVVISVDDDRKRGLDSGASEYLTKPTTQEHLAGVLKTFNTTTAGHVLVVDDDEDAGNIIERAARQVGLEVSRAFDGVTGLEMARAHKPCAIVLDLTMPRKDGFSVLSELSTDPQLRTVPVIIVSARTLNGDEFSKIAKSGCDFHTKGVSSPHDIAANLISVVGT